MAQLVANPPAMQETWVQSLGREDPLEKGPATQYSILAYSPWVCKELDMTERLSLKALFKKEIMKILKDLRKNINKMQITLKRN